jgi:transcriptional regulator with XRE-family HTH domain
MDKRSDEKTTRGALGPYLASLRNAKKLTLREVEEATGKVVSNAYLSQLEHGRISRPSPNILHSLAEAYGVAYESLMEKAGYITTNGQRQPGQKHGRAATFATVNLTGEEEEELLRYLTYYRSRKGKRDAT